jgi:hypothetical protein
MRGTDRGRSDKCAIDSLSDIWCRNRLMRRSPGSRNCKCAIYGLGDNCANCVEFAI